MKFIDSNNNEFSLKLTLGNVKNVYDNLGIDLMNPASIDEKTQLPISARLIYDDLFLVDVVSELLSNQLKEKNISKQAFLDSLDGHCLKNLSDAFFIEYESFFTDRGRDVWARAIQKDRNKALEDMRKANLELRGDESSISPEEADSLTGNSIVSGN